MSNQKKSKEFNKIFLGIDHSLDSFDRFIFFRLWLLDQEKEKSAQWTLNHLVEKLKVGQEKLKKSLLVLSKKGLIVLQDGERIALNSPYRFSSKRSCQLLGVNIVLISDIGKFRFHHKQKNKDECFELDYKAWLVLFCLILFSDQHGIVIKVGMHEFNIFTGMDRYSVRRVLNKLFSFGILRSKLNGTLDSEYLSFTSAIYFLNLSHPLWGEYRKYQKFKFISLPSQFNLFEQGLFVIENMTKIYQGERDEPIFPFLFKTQEENILTIQKMNNIDLLLTSYPYHILNEVNIVERKKWKTISLKSTKNKENNLNRLEFMFKYLVQFLKISDHKIMQISVNFIRKYIVFAKRYFLVNQLDLTKTKPHPLMSQKEEQRGVEEMQFFLYAFMSYILMQNVVSILTRKKRVLDAYSTIMPIPVVNPNWDGYVMPSRGLKEDELYEISLIEEDKVYKTALGEEYKIYKRIEQKIEMTIEDQKKYGLLHTSCEALKF